MSDLAAASSIAARIHPDYPEDDAVMEERLRLCPEGCFALTADGDLLGYAVGHPWHARSVPDLDTLIGSLPELGSLPGPAGAWCIHDVALLPEARGRGAAAALVGLMRDEARRRGLPAMVLVAVGDAAGFWRRHGFRPIPEAPPPGYGAGATLMKRDA
ncbi:GNAT family N-acetyltransferase [Methylobacterium currus]|uniref:GNAT family N-acetyltransferase n=1 Tax=Methylobacterium currus TaxID=2051553 RepID=A0A2R4WIZ6_9HYPH|nr:GNAT family N-acetyltransferase [Methylobacterium currus]AWB21522.1 GNAT family N-acetyltransferase [Methylobacterium currus]